ncbi:MAG: hypothetical protein BWZ01_02906 [Deltaproteobacteria bacterium ADurb.BinA179]|nr:MAG: hypothetical protein BWZ01_02906 [Deltaproteobacteria bacterium ADurb.BinA179]
MPRIICLEACRTAVGSRAIELAGKTPGNGNRKHVAEQLILDVFFRHLHDIDGERICIGDARRLIDPQHAHVELFEDLRGRDVCDRFSFPVLHASCSLRATRIRAPRRLETSVETRAIRAGPFPVSAACRRIFREIRPSRTHREQYTGYYYSIGPAVLMIYAGAGAKTSPVRLRDGEA